MRLSMASVTEKSTRQTLQGLRNQRRSSGEPPENLRPPHATARFQHRGPSASDKPDYTTRCPSNEHASAPEFEDRSTDLRTKSHSQGFPSSASRTSTPARKATSSSGPIIFQARRTNSLLSLLLWCVVALGAWAIVLPSFSLPDETSHTGSELGNITDVLDQTAVEADRLTNLSGFILPHSYKFTLSSINLHMHHYDKWMNQNQSVDEMPLERAMGEFFEACIDTGEQMFKTVHLNEDSLVTVLGHFEAAREGLSSIEQRLGTAKFPALQRWLHKSQMKQTVERLLAATAIEVEQLARIIEELIASVDNSRLKTLMFATEINGTITDPDPARAALAEELKSLILVAFSRFDSIEPRLLSTFDALQGYKVGLNKAFAIWSDIHLPQSHSLLPKELNLTLRQFDISIRQMERAVAERDAVRKRHNAREEYYVEI